MSKKKGRGFIICGLLFITAALALTVYNIYMQKAAEISSLNIINELAGKISDNNNLPPDYMLNPDMEMPEIKVDKSSYIAIISIPSLGLRLPVNTEWTYKNLKKSPCRYYGSAYSGDLIICAHNYDVHFGNIKYLNTGDSVKITDMDGNNFYYKVSETETLKPDAVEELKSGDWDLTLFTCTIGGQTRITVRCDLDGQ